MLAYVFSNLLNNNIKTRRNGAEETSVLRSGSAIEQRDNGMSERAPLIPAIFHPSNP